MAKYRICKGGYLFKKSRSKSDSTGEDVTQMAISCLFHQCDLQDGVTLQDVMLLINTNLPAFATVLGNWCEEFVQEAVQY